MRPTRISGADPKPLGAPSDWNEAESGHCNALFVRREQVEGVAYMRSAWEVETSEAAMLLAGAKLTLGVAGHQHPVVSLRVGELPADFEPVVIARQYTDTAGRACVHVEMVFSEGNGQRGYSNVLIGDNLSEAVALGITQIEELARKQGWMKER